MKVKKTVFMVASFLIALFLGTQVLYAEDFNTESMTFLDVQNSSDWFYHAVEYDNTHGYMTGLNAEYFGVSQTLTRAEFAEVIYKICEKPDVEYEDVFPDVPKDQWYADAIIWCYQNHIVVGYDNGEFGPRDVITREQLSVMLYRFALYRNMYTIVSGHLSLYPDGYTTSLFARDAMRWCLGNGILSGYGDGYLRPQNTADRAQCAAMIQRFLERQEYLDKYQDSETVNQLIYVQYKNGSNAIAYLYTKDDQGSWGMDTSIDAYLGRNGVGIANEYVSFTPVGDYGFTVAFGILDDPDSMIPYTKVTSTMYWCNENSRWYNQFVDTSVTAHSCNGEHLIEVAPAYNYALAMDYNSANIYPNGSAFFLHCYSGKTYTGGCVAVPEEVMKKILQTVDRNARIVISR